MVTWARWWWMNTARCCCCHCSQYWCYCYFVAIMPWTIAFIPRRPPGTRVWQDPGTRPHLILVFHSYKLMDAASKIRAYPFYPDTENHFFVSARTAQDPVDAFLVFLIYWSKSSVSLKDTINCLEKAMKISHFNHIMIELCYFSLHQSVIKIHMLWGKCFNIPHWLRSHSTNGRLQHIEELSKSKTRVGMVWL